MQGNVRAVLGLLAVLGLVGGRAAADQPPAAEPGVLWEQTVEMQMQGFSMPPTTSKFCAPKKDWSQPPKGRDDDHCKVTDVKHDGPHMTWKMACEGKERMTGEGDLVHQGTSFSGRITMHSSHGDMVMKMQGKTLGEACDAGETKRTAEAVKRQATEAQASAAAAMAKVCDDAVKQMAVQTFVYSPSCKDRQADFCARANTCPGWAILMKRQQEERGQVEKLCGSSLEALRPSCCASAAKQLAAPGSAGNPARKDDVAFVSAYCPDQARALAQRDCAGASYTGMEPTQRDFCVQYAADRQAAKPKAPPATSQDEAQKKAEDTAKKAVKGLFGF